MSNVTPELRRLRELVMRIDAIHDEILFVRGSAILECKKLRARIKDVYDQAADDGWPKPALKVAYTRLRLKRMIEEQRARLEGELQNDLDKIERALSWESTPLGMAMMGEEQ